MLSTDKAQKAFYILTIVVSVGIAWRTFGSSIVNGICRLNGISPIITFENNLDVFKQLVNLAMTMLATMFGSKGVDKYINYRTECQLPRETKRDPESRTRKDDIKESTHE